MVTEVRTKCLEQSLTPSTASVQHRHVLTSAVGLLLIIIIIVIIILVILQQSFHREDILTPTNNILLKMQFFKRHFLLFITFINFVYKNCLLCAAGTVLSPSRVSTH